MTRVTTSAQFDHNTESSTRCGSALGRGLRAALALTLAGLALCLARPALADAELIPGLTRTSRTGFEGTRITELGAPSGEHAVSRLELGERGDRPCFIAVDKADVNYDPVALSVEWNECDGRVRGLETIGWDAGSGLFVRGIQACTNNKSNERLKGVRLHAAWVIDGVAIDWATSESTDTFDRANCTVWHSPVYCPAGQIATKVRIHRTGDEINGLSLACRAPQFVP